MSFHEQHVHCKPQPQCVTNMLRAFFQRGHFSRRGISMQDVAVAAVLGVASGYYIMLPMIQESGARALKNKQQGADGSSVASANTAAGAPTKKP